MQSMLSCQNKSFRTGWGLCRILIKIPEGLGGHFCVQKMEILWTGELCEIFIAKGYGSIFTGATQKGWCCYITSYSKQNNQNTSNCGFGNTKVLISLSMLWAGGVKWINFPVESTESNFLDGGINC